MKRAVGSALLTAWCGLLWIGAWPFHRPALLASASAASRGVLATIGVAPGLGVFTGVEGDWRLVAECLSVTAEVRGAGAKTVYATECPPRGFHLRHGAFDRLLQLSVRHVDLGKLTRPYSWGSATLPEPARRFALIGDYFCHAHAPAEPREQVTMVRRQRLRSYSSGLVAENGLSCTWSCDPAVLAKATCEFLAPRMIE